MAPGARSKLGTPVFEAELFTKQIYCTEGSTCDIFGTFRRPHSDSAPGELYPPCPPRYALGSCFVTHNVWVIKIKVFCLASSAFANVRRVKIFVSYEIVRYDLCFEELLFVCATCWDKKRLRGINARFLSFITTQCKIISLYKLVYWFEGWSV